MATRLAVSENALPALTMPASRSRTEPCRRRAVASLGRLTTVGRTAGFTSRFNDGPDTGWSIQPLGIVDLPRPYGLPGTSRKPVPFKGSRWAQDVTSPSFPPPCQNPHRSLRCCGQAGRREGTGGQIACRRRPAFRQAARRMPAEGAMDPVDTSGEGVFRLLAGPQATARRVTRSSARARQGQPSAIQMQEMPAPISGRGHPL